MSKRWYDAFPTLSMAVSLLQNAETEHQLQAVSYLEEKLHREHPWVLDRQQEITSSVLLFRQKRRMMDEDAWSVVESLKFLEDPDKEVFAAELIHYIYRLEVEGILKSSPDADFPDLEAAM